MELPQSPLGNSSLGSSSSSPIRRRRFSKGPAVGGVRGPFAWLQRHPLAAAALYMIFGGCVVYMLLNSSYERRQQQQHDDGILRLPALPAPAVDPASPAPATFRIAQAAARDSICTDTCFKANDGICDDGRFLHNMTRSQPSRVLCDLGSDCNDCGPWKGVQHSSSWKEPVGPVEFLRQHNLTMLTKKSAFEPRFHFAFTDPQHDIDASRDFAGFSTLEQRLSHIAYHVLHTPCQQGAAVGGSSSALTDSSKGDEDNDSDQQQRQQQQQQEGGQTGAAEEQAAEEQQQQVLPEGLMLDVGAGFGWYSLLAGMLGCRVIAWEPVKIFQAYLEYSIARNRLQHKVEVRAAAVMAPAGSGVAVNTSTLPSVNTQQQQPQQPNHQQPQSQQQQQQQPTPSAQQRRKLQGRQMPQSLRLFGPMQPTTQPLEASGGSHPAASAATGSKQGVNVTVVAPTRGLWGTASVDGRSIYMALSSGGAFHKYEVPAETLDAVILPLLHSQQQKQQKQQPQQEQHPQQQQQQQDEGAPRQHSRVVLLKVDVEGHEPEVVASAAGLLSGQLVDNVLLEYAPHVAETHNITQASQYPHMLLRLLKAGFSLGQVADMNYLKRPLSTYSEPLQRLQAITEDNLKYDLFDCMQMTEVGLTWLHEPCTEMLSYGLISEGIPERLHPKSFRSTFEVNTHVWATRQERYAPYTKGPTVGVFPPNRKLSQGWFVEESTVFDRAMGGRSCKNLREVAAYDKLSSSAKASFLISHRCRCAVSGDSPCAQEEQLADACALSGRTPFREEPDYVPDR